MGKGGDVTIGFWYYVLFWMGLGIGPIDAFLEIRGGDKTAWSGELTESGIFHVDAGNLWGGEKDQGGIDGDFEILFGDADAPPNEYLLQNLGDQVPAMRGLATILYRGGRYGAMNPFPQKPSFKFRKIKAGWDEACWYPEKAEIVMTGSHTLPANAPGWQYQAVAFEDQPGKRNLAIPTDGWQDGGVGPFTDENVWPIGKEFWARRTVTVGAGTQLMTVAADNGCVVFVNGAIVGTSNRDNKPIDGNQKYPVTFPVQAGKTYELAVKAFTEANPADDAGNYCSISIQAQGLTGINPAHLLYYARTQKHMGREPVASMNDASFRSAADWYYAQGFGLCCDYDPAQESVDDFIARIEKVAGCSMNRSPTNGQWYIDIANGEYDIDALPILTDDDILEWEDQPSTLDSAVNSVSVQFFDPQQKVSVSTPPVQALGLINAFGTIHQDTTYKEIPTSELATRVANRDLLQTTTPTQGFQLTSTRKPYSWRRGTYFRLQSRKRGIADMVCIVGDIQRGKLKSGAIRMTAAQDVYSLPASSFVQVDPGVDTRPSPVPVGIVLQRAIEASYIDVVRNVPLANLKNLDKNIGFALGIAKDPLNSRNFTMTVFDGDLYQDVAQGEWTPSAVIVEGDDRSGGNLRTDFTFNGSDRLRSIAAGAAGLWDDEIVRVDAIDVTAGTITLGRGCADTVPAQHDANSRIWFYQAGYASDNTQYDDGESIEIKLLTNTGVAQLDPDLATEIDLTFDARWSRPYPPGNLKIAGDVFPTSVNDTFTVTWAHRNRISQADQLVDTTAGSVTPYDNMRYGLRFLDANGNELVSREDIGAPTADVTLDYTGQVTMELWGIDDINSSLQRHRISFAYTPPNGATNTISATAYTPVFDGTIYDGGNAGTGV